MNRISFPVIDPVATGENIQRLRREKGLSVRDLQNFFGFEEPQAIYKWQRGKSLPSVDNLYALSALLDVSMDDIIVSRTIQLNRYNDEQQAVACCSAFLLSGCFGYGSVPVCFDRFSSCIYRACWLVVNAELRCPKAPGFEGPRAIYLRKDRFC